MKVLITGANGLLGQHLVKLLLDKQFHVIATGRGASRLPFPPSPLFTWYSMDITDMNEVFAVMSKELPEVVIHAATATQVDYCELNPQQCEAINVHGTSTVLTDAETFSSHFVYISTDFVFDGEKGNYGEEDEPKPVNWYGFTKMQAEAIVQSATMPWTIVRTCLVYGNVLQGTRSNIINWVKENLEQGRSIKVVADQWRTPTYVEDLARGIALVVEKRAPGIFHISGKDRLSPYQIALQTAGYLKLDSSLIQKVDASIFSQPGRRPPNTGFVIEKARKELGFEPLSFAEGLKEMMD